MLYARNQQSLDSPLVNRKAVNYFKDYQPVISLLALGTALVTNENLSFHWHTPIRYRLTCALVRNPEY
jgi:hypothetical protein